MAFFNLSVCVTMALFSLLTFIWIFDPQLEVSGACVVNLADTVGKYYDMAPLSDQYWSFETTGHPHNFTYNVTFCNNSFYCTYYNIHERRGSILQSWEGSHNCFFPGYWPQTPFKHNDIPIVGKLIHESSTGGVSFKIPGNVAFAVVRNRISVLNITCDTSYSNKELRLYDVIEHPIDVYTFYMISGAVCESQSKYYTSFVGTLTQVNNGVVVGTGLSIEIKYDESNTNNDNYGIISITIVSEIFGTFTTSNNKNETICILQRNKIASFMSDVFSGDSSLYAGTIMLQWNKYHIMQGMFWDSIGEGYYITGTPLSDDKKEIMFDIDDQY